MQDEFGGVIVEFVGLKSKMYSIIMYNVTLVKNVIQQKE